MIAVISGLFFGLVAIIIKRLAARHSLSLICLVNLGSFLPLWAVSGFIVPVEATLIDWSILVYLGVFQLGLAYIFFNRALRTISPLTGSFVSLIEPLLNPLWVWLLIGEIPTLHGIIGWCCLMASLLLYLRNRKAVTSRNSGSY